jgi:ubiquinone/menaquinone biosynthesis C-methylase UbiE
MINSDKEIEKIKERYNRRNSISKDIYSPLKTDVILRRHEFERNLIRILRKNFSYDIQNLKLLEIGCGTGINLLKFIELGFNPENLTGNELLEERLLKARKVLPGEVELLNGDSLKLKFDSETFDIVFQSTVFTSILDDEFKKKLAEKMLSWVKPGGGILWYDFIYNNPSNPDVKGVSKKKVKELFPKTEIYFKKITMAPPISRLVTKISPSLYYFFNIIPLLRTHLICWIKKI